jgi:UDP-glucose 4-epimerase
MKTILITGACGYIGSHIAHALSETPSVIHGVDKNIEQNDIRDVCTVFKWDITDPLTVPSELLSDYDIIIHLASETMVSHSVENPWMHYHTNVAGTNQILQLFNTDHFIYGSSSSAHHPESSPYATSKFMAESLVKASGQPYTLARFYNVSGNSGYQKYEASYYHLIRKLAAVVCGKFPEFVIYGDSYGTPDGTAIRNYTHVTDIVSSVVKLCDHGATSQPECLGSTRGYSVLEVAHIMQAIAGKSIDWVYESARPGDVAQSHMPMQSQFFSETLNIQAQCESALEAERDT